VRQACHQSLLDRIRCDGHNNGDCGGCPVRRHRLLGSGRDNDIHLRLYEVGDEARQVLGPTLSEGKSHDEVPALLVIQLTHRIEEGPP